MGADLFLRSEFDRLQQEHQSDFEFAVAKRDRARTPGEHDRAQGEVSRIHDLMHPPSAYFRDPYNKWSLLAQLGLSWWNDISPLLDLEDRLPLEKVEWLRREVLIRRLHGQGRPTFEQIVASEAIAEVCGDRSGGAKPDVIASYTANDLEWFVTKKAALLVFLGEALRVAEPPVFSL